LNLIIIPSLEPDYKLLKLVDELRKAKLDKIIVVDDGTKNQEIFNKLDVPVIHHSKNLGKGAAIKSAVRGYLKYYKDITGFITVDSDGQHLVKDIKRIDNNLKDEVVLGVRNFKLDSVPLRSKFGNFFSSLYFYLTTHQKLEDTQTGLRGIPIKYKDLLLETDGDRFEFEMNFLYKVIDNGGKLEKIQIDTVYEDKRNHKSHFHTISDSYRIYKELINYTLVSIISAVIDLGLFSIFNKFLLLSIMISTIITRIISGLFNFLMNKNIVFKSYNKNSFIKYIILFITIMLLSGTFTSIFNFIKIDTTIIKLFVDICLYVVSYVVQKRVVFKGDK